MSTFVTVSYGRPRAGGDCVLRGLSSEWDPWKASPACQHLRQDSELVQRRTSQAEGAAWGGGDSSSGRQPAGLGLLVRLDPRAVSWRRLAPQTQWRLAELSAGERYGSGPFRKCFSFPGCCLDSGSEGSQSIHGETR